MIPEWETNKCYFSALLEKQHPALWDSLHSILSKAGVTARTIPGTRDIWARDFMPIQVEEKTFCQFIYRPDYLKAHEALITPPRACRSKGITSCRQIPLVLDGGNVVAASNRVILTDKVYQENPTRKRPEIRKLLSEVFQAEIIIIPREPYDIYGHADGVLRFIGDDTVVVNEYSLIDPAYGKRLRAALKAHRIECEQLPYFIKNEAAGSAVGCWTNFLHTGKVIIVPEYGVQQDAVVLKKLETLLPGTNLIPLRRNKLAAKGGVLRCVSWTIRAS